MFTTCCEYDDGRVLRVDTSTGNYELVNKEGKVVKSGCVDDETDPLMIDEFKEMGVWID